MISLGKPFINNSKLCCSVTINKQREVLWYKVPKDYIEYYVTEQSDAFVVPMLYTAIALNKNITSEAPVSPSLKFQLNHHLLPCYNKNIKIIAPNPKTKLLCENKVGTGYSGGVDCFYTIMKNTTGSYPKLTHLCPINVGVYEEDSKFENLIKKTYDLADETNLECFYINSNIHKVLKDSYLEVYSYRIMGAVLALQKLFSSYLYSSGHPLQNFKFSKNNCAEQDLLNIQCLSTEYTNFISTGSGVLRTQKLKELSDYPPCYKRLHPCFKQEDKNCGYCKKCRRDTITLMELNTIDKFKDVYDVELAKRNRDINIAFLLANQKSDLYADTLELIDKMPKRSYVIAEQLKKGMNTLEQN